MATKRPASHVHPSRSDQVPDEPRRKRQKPSNAGPKSYKKAHTVNDLKSQIRSLKRLLQRNDDLPANVRVEKERALQTAQHELDAVERAKKRSDIIGRYHKIRFFDRQKAAKRLKRAQKELKACEEGDARREELLQRVHDAQVDVNYAQYYPLERNYVSLFPRKKNVETEDDAEESTKDEDDNTTAKGDPEMWQQVKQSMLDGTLDALRNGRLLDSSPTPDSTDQAKMVREAKFASVKDRVKTGTVDHEVVGGEDDDSDGGFFE